MERGGNPGVPRIVSKGKGREKSPHSPPKTSKNHEKEGHRFKSREESKPKSSGLGRPRKKESINASSLPEIIEPSYMTAKQSSRNHHQHGNKENPGTGSSSQLPQPQPRKIGPVRNTPYPVGPLDQTQNYIKGWEVYQPEMSSNDTSGSYPTSASMHLERTHEANVSWAEYSQSTSTSNLQQGPAPNPQEETPIVSNFYEGDRNPTLNMSPGSLGASSSWPHAARATRGHTSENRRIELVHDRIQKTRRIPICVTDGHGFFEAVDALEDPESEKSVISASVLTDLGWNPLPVPEGINTTFRSTHGLIIAEEYATIVIKSRKPFYIPPTVVDVYVSRTPLPHCELIIGPAMMEWLRSGGSQQPLIPPADNGSSTAPSGRYLAARAPSSGGYNQSSLTYDSIPVSSTNDWPPGDATSSTSFTTYTNSGVEQTSESLAELSTNCLVDGSTGILNPFNERIAKNNGWNHPFSSLD